MHIAAILLPVFILVLLTYALLGWLAVARKRELASGQVHLGDVALDNKRWGARSLQISNCYDNQFVMPMLFYVLVAFALITRKADYVFIVMEWVFVLARLGHAYVHTGSNQVALRGGVFMIATATLAVMWIIFALRILFAPVLL